MKTRRPLHGAPTRSGVALALALLGCAGAQRTEARSQSIAPSPPRHADAAVPSASPSAAEAPAPTAAAPVAAATAHPGEPLVVARDLEWPWLLGTDDRYVYWVDHDSDPVAPEEEYTHKSRHLMRTLKSGGGSNELLVDAPEPSHLVFDAQNIYWIRHSEDVDDEDKFGGPDTIVVLSKGSHAFRVIVRGRPDPFGLVVQQGRLFWLETPSPGDPVDLISANVDGTGARRLWHAKENEDIALMAPDGPDLVVALTLTEHVGLGSLGSLGGGARPKPHATSLLRVPMSGGSPSAFWGNAHEARGVTADGAGWLVCEDDGIVRVPRSDPSHSTYVDHTPCRDRFQVWDGWRLYRELQLRGYNPLTAARAEPPGRHFSVFDEVAPLPFGVPADETGLYACIRSSPKSWRHCDLVRADRALIEARAAAK
jgi:hypothetical protein